MNQQVIYLLSHKAKLLAFLKRRLSDIDTAEDIFQDSLLNLLRSAPDLEEERLLTWFYRVLRNAVIDHYRRRASDERRIQSVARELPESMSPDDENDLCECFRELLPALKPEYRDVLEALELGGEDPAAAASRLGIERNNLKVRRHRARQALKEQLENTCRACAEHGCLDCTCKTGRGHMHTAG